MKRKDGEVRPFAHILRRSEKMNAPTFEKFSQDNSVVIALAGNPNVGKSTVFNELTGLNQHTGNWTGKTVSTALGHYAYQGSDYTVVDLPGTYSLTASSEEERVARDYLCFGNYDCMVIVMDATNLERNLIFTLQLLEVNSKAVICLNLCDEARKKGIEIDINELTLHLGVPVIPTSARSGEGIDELRNAVKEVTENKRKTFSVKTEYPLEIDKAIEQCGNIPKWIALKLIEQDIDFVCEIAKNCEIPLEIEGISAIIEKEKARELIAQAIVHRCEYIVRECVTLISGDYTLRDRKIDCVLTSKKTGIPIMLGLLCVIFFLTAVGANYPSEWLSSMFSYIGRLLEKGATAIGMPLFLKGLLINGVYNTLTWVVSVMLPPMAIFFPLFTLLEDLGYLPRIAFNLDSAFRKAGTHGKQALTMCMGLGCNACGVTGCRIIDSPRERLIAIITNNFMPCNGRFPMLISVINMFLVSAVILPLRAVSSAITLVAVIIVGVFVTLIVSKLLSVTVLKGKSSTFALELPPYRRPQLGRVIVRSMLDRTVFVLSRAVLVAAPAGAIIWLFANINIGGASLLSQSAEFLNPFAELFGLDGMILMGFILGFPANEIVVPIVLMGYMSTSNMVLMSSVADMGNLLVMHGWTIKTALCFITFSLMHFPCATTMLTIFKETKSIKQTLSAFLIPTLTGLFVCFVINLIL